jgi:hypothetical protein
MACSVVQGFAWAESISPVSMVGNLYEEPNATRHILKKQINFFVPVPRSIKHVIR